MWYDYISVLHNSYNPVYYYKTNTRPFHFYFLEFSKITHFGYERLLGIFKHQFCYVYLTVLSWPKVQISLLSSTPKLKNRASSRLLAKTVYLKCFETKIKPCIFKAFGQKPCISSVLGSNSKPCISKVRTPRGRVSQGLAVQFVCWFFGRKASLKKSFQKRITARPRDTRPQGARTLEIHGF